MEKSPAPLAPQSWGELMDASLFFIRDLGGMSMVLFFMEMSLRIQIVYAPSRKHPIDLMGNLSVCYIYAIVKVLISFRLRIFSPNIYTTIILQKLSRV